MLEPRGHLAQQRVLRAAREVRAEAEVLADAEAEVAVRAAVDAEGEGIVEDGVVGLKKLPVRYRFKV